MAMAISPTFPVVGGAALGRYVERLGAGNGRQPNGTLYDALSSRATPL